MSDRQPLVRVENLKKHFASRSSGLLRRTDAPVRAVDGISFEIMAGETLGLVGESGCGKSTTGRVVLGLLPATAGSITFDGTEVTELEGTELRAFRPKMQMIFQDSAASLNPRHSIGNIIGEPMDIQGEHSASEVYDRVTELMELVGLSPRWRKRFAHEFSGGQRQRINIARALALNPQFVVGDEPVSALDVSIQAQVVNLMEDLQRDLGLTYLFIAHDLSMVLHISDRIAVMYLGKMVEMAEANTLFENPLHPYTQSLISAVPIPDPKAERARKPIILEGDVPSPKNVPSGCVFHTRCPLVEDICRNEIPEYREIVPGHMAACHLIDGNDSNIIPLSSIGHGNG